MTSEQEHLLAYCQIWSRLPVYLGIDPGAEGALAFLVGKQGQFLFDIPTLKVSKGKGYKRAFNLPEICNIFRPLKPIRKRLSVIIEEAQVRMPMGIGGGAGAYTAFRAAVGFGMWPLFFTWLGVPHEVVSPITWKSAMGLKGKDKESARHKALGLFPNADIVRKKDHNRAEALLIAEWYRRRNKGG